MTMLPAILLLTATATPVHSCWSDVCEESPAWAMIAQEAWHETTLPQTTEPAKQDARHQRDLASDRELGKKFAEQVIKEYKVSPQSDMEERLDRIGAEMAAIANITKVEALWGDSRLNTFEYQFTVLEGKDVNAFSLPGGFIFFFEGMMDYVESDHELAGVVAHEIAHASLRHVATLRREQSRLDSVRLPLILIALLAGGTDAAGSTIGVTGLIAQATGSGWSVEAERAADHAGFEYMIRSNYDPTGMLTLMERLALDDRRRPGVDFGIFRTHPPSRERAEALLASMVRHNLPVRRSQVTRSFRSNVVPGENGTVRVVFGDRTIVELAGEDAISRGDEVVKRLNAFFDSTPELFEVQPGADGTVLGRRAALLQVQHQDAVAAGKDVATLQADAVRSIRTALFSIGFRVWDGI